MKARSSLFWMPSMILRLVEPVGWLGAAISLLLLLYLLTAPPVLLAHAKLTGSGSFPAVYGPVLWLIESDFGGPMVWYFNKVWHAELMLIGGEEGPPWYVVTSYILLGGIFLLAVRLPFFKLWRDNSADHGCATTRGQRASSATRGWLTIRGER